MSIICSVLKHLSFDGFAAQVVVSLTHFGLQEIVMNRVNVKKFELKRLPLPSPVNSSVECPTTRSRVYNNAHHSQNSDSTNTRYSM